MVNDYSNGANGRKGASQVKGVLSSLYEERDNLLKKIEMTKLIMRHIELTENYTTTILKHMKKNDVVDFVQAVLESECVEIAGSHPSFAKALFNGMIHHNINELWFDFFNHFSMSMFEVSKLQGLLDSLKLDDASTRNTFDDYKFMDTLVNYVLDEIDNVEPLNVRDVDSIAV